MNWAYNFAVNLIPSKSQLGWVAWVKFHSAAPSFNALQQVSHLWCPSPSPFSDQLSVRLGCLSWSSYLPDLWPVKWMTPAWFPMSDDIRDLTRGFQTDPLSVHIWKLICVRVHVWACVWVRERAREIVWESMPLYIFTRISFKSQMLPLNLFNGFPCDHLNTFGSIASSPIFAADLFLPTLPFSVPFLSSIHMEVHKEITVSLLAERAHVFLLFPHFIFPGFAATFSSNAGFVGWLCLNLKSSQPLIQCKKSFYQLLFLVHLPFNTKH